MLSRLNDELARLHERRLRRDKLVRRAAALRREAAELEKRTRDLARQLRKEDRDVQRLEGVSLAGLFYTLLGSREQQLELERQEALAARLKHDEAAERLAAVRQELESTEALLAREPDVEEKYRRLLAEKERLVQEQGHPGAGQLFALGEEAARLQEELRELEEAAAAGRAAQAELQRVVDALGSASGWGTWDMLGGGLLATAVKHSRMDDARSHAHQAQRALSHFNRELQDVQAAIDQSLHLDGLTRFADYFFDGLIVDWIVQSRIHDSLERAREVQYQVDAALRLMAARRAPAQQQLEQVSAQRQEYLARLE